MENYEDEFVKFEFKDGILFSYYKVNRIDLEVAMHITVVRLENFNMHAYPTLADCSNMLEISKEARDYFASQDSNKYYKAIGILTKSMVGALIFNFYRTLSKPSVPTKLFTDRDEAILWLAKYL